MEPLSTSDSAAKAAPLSIRAPFLEDAGGMWRVARDSGTLDLNSSYAYALFARDFSATCRVALASGDVVGFVLGFRRPDSPSHLFIWQVAVDADQRGRGLSGRLLDDLVAGLRADDEPVTWLETTITDDNVASQRLFASFARRWDAQERVEPLFEAAHFPDDHDPEPVHVIGPLRTG
ncbi:diaminobutyrate acetyltransferase [Microbacterium sp. G2-8]|uniref:diaminobutyrate acetyltransferase n=1 Tax=Microbacterium sp. G2-8 TaxID=2842454 RepID=UPI001C8A5E74|nr:diaminobutyrate acetyltransferase [Microbacterium sp. G2-8]